MMKKFSVVLSLLLLSNLLSYGNAGPPMALLREVYVESSENWAVELWLYQESGIDSIQIRFLQALCSTGRFLNFNQMIRWGYAYMTNRGGNH